jgi:hypothetical protein
MGMFDKFFNLFHRKYRFTPEYPNLSFLKKLLFFGISGFVCTLSVSKFILPSLDFAFEPTEANRLYIKLNPALERVFVVLIRESIMRVCLWCSVFFSDCMLGIVKRSLISAWRRKR